MAVPQLVLSTSMGATSLCQSVSTDDKLDGLALVVRNTKISKTSRFFIYFTLFLSTSPKDIRTFSSVLHRISSVYCSEVSTFQSSLYLAHDRLCPNHGACLFKPESSGSSVLFHTISALVHHSA